MRARPRLGIVSTPPSRVRRTALRLLVVSVLVGLPLTAQSSEAGNWTTFAGDAQSTKYSPLDQIDRANVDQLEIVFRLRSIDYGTAARDRRLRVPSSNQTSPLKVDSRLLLATGLGVAAAFDPANGELLWSYDPYELGEEPDPQLLGRGSIRGATTWRDGSTERLVFVSNGDLVSLDTSTGQPDPAFGEAGRVDMRFVGDDHPRMRSYRWSSAPLICGETIVMGSSTSDTWVRQKGEPGKIRGYDRRSGELLWVFFIIPREGEFGYDTWEQGSADYTGGANVWAWMSCDEELGRVYAATSTPGNDWYGGHRLGKGLFAEALLGLDARTGERVWHFQAVHHGLWDYDFPAGPILADVTVDGQPRKIIAQVSKQAFTYVLDRVTGEPVWPIVEMPVPASTVPGEVAWPTQPIPTWPLPFDLQGLRPDDNIDFTPELRAEAMEFLSNYQLTPLFTPPNLIEGSDEKPMIQMPGPVGGANWGGAGLDPETGILYVPSVSVPTVMGLRQPPDPSRSDLRYRVLLSEADGYDFIQLPNGLPITKPPYGRITAIDLNTGEHAWMIPNGEGPRDHPKLAGLDLPWLGQPGRVSVLITKTLLFVGDGTPVQTVQPPGGGSRMFRAYDKATGERIWEMELPNSTSGAPITYLHEGRQYIVVPTSDEGLDNEWIVLALG